MGVAEVNTPQPGTLNDGLRGGEIMQGYTCRKSATVGMRTLEAAVNLQNCNLTRQVQQFLFAC